MKFKKYILSILTLCITISGFAQDAMADNMLLFQRKYGGWPKHYLNKKIDYKKTYSSVEIATIKDDENRNDATIDNGATTQEIRYLVTAFKKTNNQSYLQAAERGIEYLLTAQYKNGGWPQFYPDLSSYRHLITYNDNAIVNVLNVLFDIVCGLNDFEVVNASYKTKAEKAIKSGIDCILKTQIKINNELTGWCQQYDENTLQVANARKFELASLATLESVGIVHFLMRIQSADTAVITAIHKAVAWLDKVKIEGYTSKIIDDATQPNGKDRVLLQDATETIWARFYDIEDGKPLFVGRDGVKRYALTEIEHERRMGYGWYGNWPERLLKKDYSTWKKKNGI
jgi:PelA/Pel-15E family pectate lyase